jgi:murein DD-endopeptidase MepM/ murein hydrolase activator NlpD
MARGKHRRPKDSSSTRTAAVAVLGASVVTPIALAQSAAAAPVSAWDRIAQCESGGRWNLPYGDASSTGGLQIQKPTWDEYGGQSIAAYPYQATKQQQIMVAEKILANQGPGAWTCNAMSGYPLSSSGPNSSYLKGGINPYAGTAPAPVDKPLPKTHHAPPRGHSSATHHTVVSGDTLYGITKAATGNAARDNWKPLYEANRSRIKDADLIYPGQVLNYPRSWSGKAYKPVSRPATPTPTPSTNPSSSAYVMPVHGRIGDSLIIGPGGCVSRTCGGHSGLDIMAAQGTPVHAAAAGTVVAVNGNAGAAYGNYVVVKHAAGLFTLYAHMSAITVHVGQSVAAGAQVGNVGATGNATGPHLHFEVRTDPSAFSASIFLNPLTWLRSHGVTV